MSLMMFQAASIMAISPGTRRQGIDVTYTYLISSWPTSPRQSPREMVLPAMTLRHEPRCPECVICHNQFSNEYDFFVEQRRHMGELPLKRFRAIGDIDLPDPIIADQPAPVAQRIFLACSDPATLPWLPYVRRLPQGVQLRARLSGTPEAAYGRATIASCEELRLAGIGDVSDAASGSCARQSGPFPTRSSAADEVGDAHSATRACTDKVASARS
ncbi:hypothetical protein HPB50_008926 [Hyalomma asiaticum]|uniref:Uncharacterized protein n=1 Tax=Hyalomma asiaticum TaxID=266040 RepID=A0ACB7TF45_HYAAI|nr:hypothetical protein HPB50_008926 [Hyalomma asiaticum]